VIGWMPSLDPRNSYSQHEFRIVLRDSQDIEILLKKTFPYDLMPQLVSPECLP
jgi:hypothetical protein